ncbi:MAG: chromosomal replication initiator protein DnaA [Clostridia bacterium]|nr:chromosomal replication initiator protein DnaA [Clostridia bacterium]
MQTFDDVWAVICEAMNEEFSKPFIAVWFANLKLAFLDEKIAVFIAKSEFFRKGIEEKHKDKIKKYLINTLGYDVEIVVLNDEEGPHDLSVYTEGAATVQTAERTEEAVSDIKTVVPQAVQNHSYTFDNFIVGASNKFAHAASLAVANNPIDNEYNPLFIHGPSGLGKTHLLNAIMNRMRELNPDVKIVYVKGDDFTNKLIEAITNKTTAQFRNTFRTVDALLIDDVQFIAGKESTQEEFFHTFNTIYEEGGQIILASDRPPREMATLEDRLQNRFESGILADIQPPNLELRIAIMKDKAAKKGVSISYEILNYLAENLTSNVRQLEGAINKICAQSFLINTPITLEMAKTAVADMISTKESANVSPDLIIETVARRDGVSVDDIKSRKRTSSIAFTRHKCIYLIHKLTGMSYGRIGEIFKRDRTTMMSSVDTVKEEIKINSIYEEEINSLIREIKGEEV